MGTVITSLVYFVLLWKYGDGSSYHLSFLGRNHTELLSSAIGSLVIQTDGSDPQIKSESSCTDVDWIDNSGFKLANFTASNCLELIPGGVELESKGFKVESNDDFTLHVYQNDKDGNSGDGYLAIPDEHLGDEYIVATYCTLGGMCQFAITGIEDSTHVAVMFPGNITQPPACINDMPIPSNVQKGTAIPFMINEGETLHFESEDDLSGAYIKADKNVGVVVGTRDALVAGSTSDTSNMIEQIIPTNKWGTEFVVMPNYLNKAGDIIKIVTKTDSTAIHIVGYTPFMIEHAGDAVERRIDWQVHSWIVATNPVMIIQIMSVDLYNGTGDVTGSPSMVLVPHVGQWVEQSMHFHCSDLYFNNFALVTDTSSGVMHNSSVPPVVDWEQIEGSDYRVQITQPNTTSTNIGVTGTKVSGYGFCGGNKAILLAADWSLKNTECSPTVPAPGDDVDNDCNGLIDEIDCSEEDLEVRYISNQTTDGEISYKLLSVKGVNLVRFFVSTCDVASITLRSLTEPDEITSVMITASNITLASYSNITDTLQSDEETVIWDCNTKHHFSLHWTNGTAKLHYEDSVLDVDVSPSIEYDEMILSAFVGSAGFVVSLPEKDCGKVYRGARTPDSFGSEFLIPVTDSDKNFSIGLTNSGPSSAYCILRTSSPLNISVSAGTTEWVTKESVQGSFTGIRLRVEGVVEISVYVMREPTEGQHHGFSVIPSDVLGPSYHMITPSDTTENCEVWSLDVDTEVVGLGTIQRDEKMAFNPNAKPNLHYRNLVNAARPVTMFCGLQKAYVQIPPRETLSKKHFIPPIDLGALSASATIYVVSVEDSTVLIIKGDYHQLDSVSLTGDVYNRTLESNMLYEINATKPIQVHLEISDVDENWHAALIIPPTDQYRENTTLFEPPPLAALSILSSSGVNENGDNMTVPALDYLERFPEKMFAVLFLSDTANTNKMYVVTNQQNYNDINELCKITPSIPGDGKDNDCDGLVDEEECTSNPTPGEIDVDIDGDINEDCAAGTSAPNLSDIALNVEYSLTPCATGKGTGDGSCCRNYVDAKKNNSIVIDGTMTEETVYTLEPSIPNTENMLPVSPFAALPDIDFNFQTTTPAPGSTAAPEETCTVAFTCPCGWVEPPKNYTRAELEEKVKEIQEKLTISKDTLSSTIRTKISATDDRVTATTVGWAAVVWLAVMVGAIVLLDITSVVRDLKMLVSNLRQVC